MLFHFLFQIVPPEVSRVLEQKSRLVALKKGEILALATHRCSDVFLVLSGKLRVDTGNTAASGATTGFLAGQDFYVENLTVTSYILHSTLVAVRNSTVQVLPLAAVHDAFRAAPSALLACVDLAEQRTHQLRHQLHRLTTRSSGVVIGRALYDLSDIDRNGVRVLPKQVTQGALASYVGMSREQVNKQMRTFEEKGLIRRVDEGFELDASFANTTILAEQT